MHAAMGSGPLSLSGVKTMNISEKRKPRMGLSAFRPLGSEFTRQTVISFSKRPILSSLLREFQFLACLPLAEKEGFLGKDARLPILRPL
jgi:hypothetical protein